MYASKTLDIRPEQGEGLDVAVDRVVNEFLTEKQMGGEFELVHTHFTISDAYKKILVVIFYNFTANESTFSSADFES